MKNLYNILTISWLLALLLTALVVAFLPQSFDKYKITVKDHSVYSWHNRVINMRYFFDLNHDGYSEEINVDCDSINRNLTICTHDGGVIDQINVDRPLVKSAGALCFGDMDGDGTVEIWYFTKREGRVYLQSLACVGAKQGNTFKFVQSPSIYVDSIWISKTWHAGDEEGAKYQGGVPFSRILDMDGDGHMELLFQISTGFSMQPRNFYIYSKEKDTLIKSPESGCALGSYINDHNPVIYDMDNNGKMEITAGSKALGNLPASFPYSDSSAWLMVFNSQLQFLFEPVEFPGFTSILEADVYRPGDSTYIAVYYQYKGKEHYRPAICLYNLEGKLIRKCIPGKLNRRKRFYLDQELISLDEEHKNRLYIVDAKGSITELNGRLDTINTRHIGGITFPDYRLDADGDGNNELCFFSTDRQKIIITRNDFSDPVTANIPNSGDGPKRMCIMLNGENKPYISAQAGGNLYLLSYSKNPLYYYKYLLYAGIYAVAFLLVLLIVQYFKKIRLDREKKLAALQINASLKQSDAHFSMNVLNSISSLFIKNETDKANELLADYIKLLRAAVIQGDKVSVPLSEELENTRRYLRLEQFRHQNGFCFHIEKDEDVNPAMPVPKMLLHTFVENAVKHGLRHRDKDGVLNITVRKMDGQTEIQVEDNGIGRVAAGKLSTFGAGRGLKIMEKLLLYYGKITGTSIRYKVMDIYGEDGTPEGTLVSILIPESK